MGNGKVWNPEDPADAVAVNPDNGKKVIQEYADPVQVVRIQAREQLQISLATLNVTNAAKVQEACNLLYLYKNL